LAVLNADRKLIQLREMTLDKLQASLENMQPLCWSCHQEERVRQAAPEKIFKGDRHVLETADQIW
jgi:hypothetical protein